MEHVKEMRRNSATAAKAASMLDSMCPHIDAGPFEVTHVLPFTETFYPDGDNLIIKMQTIADPAIDSMFEMLDCTTLSTVEKQQLYEAMQTQLRIFGLTRYFSDKLKS